MSGRRNVGSFNASTPFMPLINPPSLPFIWRSLSSLCLIQSLIPLLLLIYFRIIQILHLYLFLLFIPL